MKNTERNPIDSNPKSTINKLTDADVESFSRLGIPIGLLQQAGVGRVSNEEAREKFGFNGSGDRAGIVFPYNDPITGVRHTARLRRDHPDIVNGKAKNKYISAWGDHKHLYFVAPGCAELVHDATVPALLVEGEKSALALTAWAARNARKLLPIAMGGCWGWRGRIGKQDGPNGERLDEKGALPELSICSKDREVFVMLDANAATEPQVRAARAALVRELVSYGANVRIATVPALPNINGPDDAIGLLGDSAVQDMLDQARPVEAVAVAEAEAAIEAVCNASTDCKVGETVRAMDAVADVSDDLQREFLVTRLTAATRGSFSKKTITDGITERLRGRKQERAACAQRMEYVAAGPVDGAQVAETIAEFFRQYFVLAPAYFVILAIWTLHTHVFQSFDYTPYLTITSPTKRCAKSNLCAALGVLVARPWKTQSVSVAALARKIEKERCTMLLDEADQAFKGPAEYTSALQGALNSGFEQGGVYSRCVGEGTSMESKDFSTFCPKVIAGIKRLPDTVMDRSIPLRIQRKGKEQVERFRSRMYKPGGAVIKKQVEIWAEGVRTEIGFHQPRVIEELNDRAWDVCEPLMAIAERIGQGWGERLRVALLTVFGSESAEDDDIGIQLLRDIKDVIQEDEVKIPSKDIVARLNALETSPWSDWGHGKGLSANAVARMLKGFDIKPRGTRVGDKTPKGYLREEFEAAWRRYLSTPSLSDDFQPQQAPPVNNDAGLEPLFATATGGWCGGCENEDIPIKDAGCGGVAVEKSLEGEGQDNDDLEGTI